jgi:hypothetical protein
MAVDNLFCYSVDFNLVLESQQQPLCSFKNVELSYASYPKFMFDIFGQYSTPEVACTVFN